MDSTTAGLVLIAIGVLTMIGATKNWRIVSHSGKILNRIFGDSIARVIYFGVGIFIFVMGVGQLIGANWF